MSGALLRQRARASNDGIDRVGHLKTSQHFSDLHDQEHEVRIPAHGACTDERHCNLLELRLEKLLHFRKYPPAVLITTEGMIGPRKLDIAKGRYLRVL
jgi:hypothetical protein